MYGTIARLKVKSGHEEALTALANQWAAERVHNGLVAQFAYQLDNDPRTIMLAPVIFRDEAEAQSQRRQPGTARTFLILDATFGREPEWMDGRILVARQLEPIPG